MYGSKLILLLSEGLCLRSDCFPWSWGRFRLLKGYSKATQRLFKGYPKATQRLKAEVSHGLLNLMVRIDLYILIYLMSP